jgi:hypothetical protein
VKEPEYLTLYSYFHSALKKETMLGLLLIYFIGKFYHELADKYNKSKWGFAILGVVVYYFGTFLAGIFFAIVAELGLTNFFTDLPTMALSFFVLPFGLLACWGVYMILENTWKNQSRKTRNESLDGDMIGDSDRK